MSASCLGRQPLLLTIQGKSRPHSVYNWLSLLYFHYPCQTQKLSRRLGKTEYNHRVQLEVETQELRVDTLLSAQNSTKVHTLFCFQSQKFSNLNFFDVLVANFAGVFGIVGWNINPFPDEICIRYKKCSLFYSNPKFFRLKEIRIRFGYGSLRFFFALHNF